jgi:hypothetical protein
MSHRLSNKDVDDLVRGNYEEALADEEPWAMDSYIHNHPEADEPSELTQEYEHRYGKRAERNPSALEDDCDADD